MGRITANKYKAQGERKMKMMKWTFTRSYCNISGNPTVRETIDLQNATEEELIELWSMLTVKLAGKEGEEYIQNRKEA